MPEKGNDTKVELVVGDVVTGKVKTIYKSYAVVEVDQSDFILPAEELSWMNKNNLKRALSSGETIESVVVAISEKGEVMLSMKRLMADPWKNILQRYTSGMEVQGVICHIFPFGVIVRLEENVEGMLHKSEIPQSMLPIEQHFKLDEDIKVRLLGILPKERKMSFTLK